MKLYKSGIFRCFVEAAEHDLLFQAPERFFQKAGIEVMSGNKKELDQTIHEIVAVRYKNCPQTWKEVKKRITEDEDGLVATLKAA